MLGASVAEQRPKAVAVIGAGPSGLAAARFLSEFGHCPVVFEAGSDVGGIWAAQPTNSVVYRNLVTNLPTALMRSFDLDFPQNLSSFITGSQLGVYMAHYACHFNIRKFICFGSQVTAVRRLTDDRALEAKWEVEWQRKEEGGDPHRRQFDAVVVASGHHDAAYKPHVGGIVAWLASAAPGARTVVHAKHYDDPASFASRAVLVIGAHSSGMDIARELSHVASWVYVQSSGCAEAYSAGNCTNVPLGFELTEQGQLRLGEQFLPGPLVDTVVLATGYKYSFPFLESVELEFGSHGRYVAPLFLHIMHVRWPSLCFVGLPFGVPCPMALFEAQAQFLASQLCRLSSTIEQRANWVAERFRTVAQRPQDFHFTSSETWIYIMELIFGSGMPEKDSEVCRKQLELMQAIFSDINSRKPKVPWGEDLYRRYNYEVDWDNYTFRVIAPVGGIGGCNVEKTLIDTQSCASEE